MFLSWDQLFHGLRCWKPGFLNIQFWLFLWSEAVCKETLNHKSPRESFHKHLYKVTKAATQTPTKADHWVCWWFRNPANSPVEVGGEHPSIYRISKTSQVVIAGFLNHPQYVKGWTFTMWICQVIVLAWWKKHSWFVGSHDVRRLAEIDDFPMKSFKMREKRWHGVMCYTWYSCFLKFRRIWNSLVYFKVDRWIISRSLLPDLSQQLSPPSPNSL